MQQHAYQYSMEAPVMAPPQRVVSLVPSITESLFDLGIGDRVVGVTEYCIYPAAGVARLPKTGGPKNPDIARIIALQPDLVMANAEENQLSDIQAMQAAGLAVWVSFPRTVNDALNLLWNIMHVFNVTEMVPRVRLIEQTLDWVRGISQGQADKLPRVFVPIWYDPLMTFNADTYIHDVLSVCGGKNVFQDRMRLYPLAADLGQGALVEAPGRDTRYPRVTLDEVVAAQPDIMLLPTEPFNFTEDHVAFFSTLDVPAARHHRIHIVDGSLLTWHGTRLAHALNTLPAILTAGN